MKYIIAYDLGTGGTKASLFDQNGSSHASAFVSCDTFYPKTDYREQRPDDWWNSVVVSTAEMLAKAGVKKSDILALAVSGHSLGAVPVGKNGELLARQVPIWNDARAGGEAAEFFKNIDESSWYLNTGNGFPPPLYAVFKMMWYKANMPTLYEQTEKFIGTKDYINYRMTGVLCTDHSYASGSGVYSLTENRYVEEYIAAAGIAPEKLPRIYPSTQPLGRLLPGAAEQLGLSEETLVVCGGVDNACMATGAGCLGGGDAYTSLGTSSWIAVTSAKPVVSVQKRPYVFAHCLPGQYVSATSIFSAGNSFRWVRDTLCKDLTQAEANGGINAYKAMDEEAKRSAAGAHRLIFNPSMAGGSGLDKSANVRGGFIGLDLMHTRADVIRATLEGVCLNLRMALDALGRHTALTEDMLIVGGGGKSEFWRGLFANIYNKNIIETNVGEDAGSLGAAAVAAVGCGLWPDFTPLKTIHKVQRVVKPEAEAVALYEKILPVFEKISELQADIGDMLAAL